MIDRDALIHARAFEIFGVAARFTPRGGGPAVAVTARRLREQPGNGQLVPGWSPAPTRQVAPSYVALRRAEVPADPSGGVLEVLDGPDAGLYDIGDCTAQARGGLWHLPLNPQVRR